MSRMPADPRPWGPRESYTPQIATKRKSVRLLSPFDPSRFTQSRLGVSLRFSIPAHGPTLLMVRNGAATASSGRTVSATSHINIQRAFPQDEVIFQTGVHLFSPPPPPAPRSLGCTRQSSRLTVAFGWTNRTLWDGLVWVQHSNTRIWLLRARIAVLRSILPQRGPEGVYLSLRAC